MSSVGRTASSDDNSSSLPPCRRSGKTLTIGIPASILSITPHLREKTALTGFLGRAAAIFRVDRILLYLDPVSSQESKDVSLLVKILRYLDTPQYLRKLLYPIDDQLRYVGILPPLRTPHHPLSNELQHLSPGDLREAVVVNSGSASSEVEIGLGKLVHLVDPLLDVGSRVTVKMLRVGQTPLARLARSGEIQTYWGYVVCDCTMPLGSILSSFKFDLTIATSRRGEAWRRVAGEIRRRLTEADSTLLLFGSYNAGLQEILAHENLKLGDVVQFTVNTIPLQGTVTVRTEEALFATLALLRVL